MTRSGRWLFRTVLAAVCWFATTPAAPPARAADVDDDPAVRVFQTIRPSVVAIKDEVSSGTGIVLDAAGLILTNAHVVDAPAAFTVTVGEPQPDGSERPVTYKRVTVVGYHPTLDLALLRIDPREHAAVKLVPAPLGKSRVRTGQRVFAIGNPGVGDGALVLEKTLTGGMISCADREIDGLHYYQFDAPVNPGNSGGPLCDRQGNVLGVVTLRFARVEAIAFAIPITALDTNQFGPREQRKPNVPAAQEWARLGNLAADAADRIAQTEGTRGPRADERIRLLAEAIHCFGNATLFDPTNSEYNRHLGAILRVGGMRQLARAYLTRSLGYHTWQPGGMVYHDLGILLARDSDDDGALAAFTEATAKFPDRHTLWDDLATFQFTHDHYPEATRAASMALLLGVTGSRAAYLRKVIGASRQHMTAAELQTINAQTTAKALLAEVDRLTAAANDARADHKLYVTDTFAALMHRLNVTEYPIALARIPAQPLQRRGDLDAAVAHAQDKAPTGGIVITPARKQPLPTVTDAGH